MEHLTAPQADGLDGQQTADALVAARAAVTATEARELLLVAHWADLHAPESITVRHDPAGRVLPGTERALSYGGDGTPQVAEFATSELALLLGVSEVTAHHLVRDTLDLRHRHPLLWARLVDAADADSPDRDPAHAVSLPRLWQARQIARACHAAGLTLEQTAWVDAVTTPHLGTLPWGRFLNLLGAKIIAADPEGADTRRREAELKRYVAAGRSNEHGLKTLIVQATAGDVIVFVAMCDRIAQCLELDGDSDPVDVRRAKAIRILANPAEALALLLRHAAVTPDAATVEADTPRPTQAADLFLDRRVDAQEPTADPAGPADDLRDLGGPPEDPPDLRVDDLHPADHDDEPLARPQTCPACGRSGEESAHRPVKVDPGKLRPRAVLHLHLSEDSFLRDRHGVARFENGSGPLTLGQARDLLGHAHVTIRPVIDLHRQTTVDAYEIPDRLGEAVRLTSPHSVFPFAPTSSRSTQIDIDHTQPHRPGQQHQTRLANLGPLSRTSHRVKTFARGWSHVQPTTGVHHWRTKHGYAFRVDADGTHPLGKMTAADFHRLTRLEPMQLDDASYARLQSHASA